MSEGKERKPDMMSTTSTQRATSPPPLLGEFERQRDKLALRMRILIGIRQSTVGELRHFVECMTVLMKEARTEDKE